MMPSGPKAPPPPPAPFKDVSSDLDAAAAESKQKALALSNMGGTIVTGGQGVTNPTTPTTRTLLGT